MMSGEGMLRLNIGPNSGQNVRTVIKCDQIILKDNDLTETLNSRLEKIEELAAKVDIVAKQLDEMMKMLKEIYYAPGMPGFEAAKQEFHDIAISQT